MFNAIIKTVFGSFAAAVVITGCSSSGANEAAKLYSDAETAQKDGDNSRAIILLDSLDSHFKQEVDLRRRGMHVRALAMEGIYTTQLTTADSVIAVTQIHVDSVARIMKRVENPVEPYYVADGSSLAPTGIQARVSPDGVFYIVSSLDGHRIGHTSISLSSELGSVSTATVGYDGERNTRSGSLETVHFVGAESDTIGRFALDNIGQPMKLTFNGSSSYSRPLTVSEANALATAYDYASSMVRLKVASLEHERLEKQLAIARSHSARTFDDNDKPE